MSFSEVVLPGAVLPRFVHALFRFGILFSMMMAVFNIFQLLVIWVTSNLINVSNHKLAIGGSLNGSCTPWGSHAYLMHGSYARAIIIAMRASSCSVRTHMIEEHFAWSVIALPTGSEWQNLWGSREALIILSEAWMHIAQ